jgi:hypothetical protein
MAQNFSRNLEVIQLLLRNLSRVRAHNEMDFVRLAIDLLKQALQIDRSTCTSGGNYQFHFCLSVISSEAKGEVEKSLDPLNTSQKSSTSFDII